MNVRRFLRLRQFTVVAAALVLMLGPTLVHGMCYARPDLVRVPVKQLIENLERQAAANPDDLEIANNLARAHAMAYATADAEFEVQNAARDAGIWFGYEPPNVPFANAHQAGAERRKDAEKHLQQAIEIYEKLIKQDEKQTVARLGYAWCLDQAQAKDKANKAKAIEQYRQVIKAAWEQEKGMTNAGLGFRSVVSEAAQYLIPLLDPMQDAAEIADLTAKAQQTDAIPRPITPIAIPLRPGLTAADLLNSSAAVAFDADGANRPGVRWTWITTQAGWLVYDREHTGQIDSALQLFGNVTFWMFWENGYAPLAALDDDHDGELRGAELQHLAIWHDVNADGQSDSGEVRPLAAYDIVALSTHAEHPGGDRALPNTAAWNPHGVTFSTGEIRPTYDLVLEQSGPKSIPGQRD